MRHGDLLAPVRHRRAAPDRRARFGARLYPAPRGRVERDRERDHRALSRIERDVLSGVAAERWRPDRRQAAPGSDVREGGTAVGVRRPRAHDPVRAHPYPPRRQWLYALDPVTQRPAVMADDSLDFP